MKQNNGIADRSDWLCWRRWLKIALCTFAIAAIAIGSGWNQSALAQEVQPIGAERLQKAKALRAISEPSEWYEPPVFESAGGELDVTLTIGGDNPYEFEGLDLPDDKATLRTYAGQCTSGNCQEDNVDAAVGPTLKVNAGDTLKVHLVNNLPANDDSYCNGEPSDKVHCFNTTNLHTHGLHISPRDNSDNVLLDIQPQTTFDFQFDIPTNHYPGTFWYHPHKHGSTSLQVASGMAGALIVKDPESSGFPDSIKNAKDRTFVFEQLAFDADGEIKELPDECDQFEGDYEDMASTLFYNFDGQNGNCLDNDNYGLPKYTGINGQQVPLINMQPGEVERWRFIDAGLFVTLDIVLVDPISGNKLDLYEIALDGITLKNVRRVNEVKMAPGYRADVMVQAPETPGDYYLYKDGRGSQKLFPFARPRGILEETIPDEILAIVSVGGDACDGDVSCHSDLPADGEALPAPSILPDIEQGEVTGDRTVEFTSGFTINNKKFDINRVDYCLKEDGVEEWKLSSGEGVRSHPFHIHVNAFQVVDPGATDFQVADWHDTVLVNEGDPFIMRTRYEDFDGQFVFHCHILTHEDQGMMSLVEINSTGGDTCNSSD